VTSHTQTGSSTLDAVSSFLPELLITPLNSGLITQDQATYKVNFHACLLFADISGFTALAEKFDQEGTEGAEKLTLVLNRYFGGFIDIVNGHGGDIAKFAGDALLAVWPIQNPEERMLQARQVQACGMALQSFMSSQTIIGPEKLKMKVAVSMGNLRMVCIGGLLNRREMILASQALAELLIRPGEV
jgi:class 3 adenylate cyclase